MIILIITILVVVIIIVVFVIIVIIVVVIIILITGYRYGKIPWNDADLALIGTSNGVPKLCLQVSITCILFIMFKTESFASQSCSSATSVQYTIHYTYTVHVHCKAYGTSRSGHNTMEPVIVIVTA